MIQNLKKFIEHNKFNLFLIDAAGVLYTDAGAIPGAPEAVDFLKSKGPVYIVTNNSYQTPSAIAKRFSESKFNIDAKQILTPGLGIQYDESIKSMISNKNVYVYGREFSLPYFDNSNCAKIVPTLDDADVIAMMSTYKPDNINPFNDLKNHILKNPSKQIFCCNPDIHVVTHENVKKPVIGYYAKKLQNETHTPVLFFGKPFENFSKMVKQIIEKEGPRLSLKTCFFDDNLENVTDMSQHIGISGACITDTGLSQHISKSLNSKNPAATDTQPNSQIYFVSKLSI
ncbi:hypothetical protein HOH45_01810 [bacterium]|jgi:HAD superfamily hydrolase (TIGR01450 family)|nr:hypothetical protein [bacterium]